MRGRAVDLVIACVLYIPRSSTFGTGRLDRVPYVYRWVPSLQWVTSHRPKPILNLSYSIVPEIGPLIGLFDYPKSVSEILQDNL